MAAMTSSMLKIYYHPALIRQASLVRMLEHTGTPYEHISDRAQMATVCSTWGGAGDTFAPPVVVDGDFVISQSVATCLYVGRKVGLLPAGQEFKAMQYCADIVDVFEGGVGKNNEAGPALKAFLEGPRFAALMGNLERGIKGPFYFGDEPSCVDFFMLQHLDWRIVSLFAPLKARHGVDVLAPYPKVLGIYEKLTATDAYKNYKGGMKVGMGVVKDEILEAYHS